MIYWNDINEVKPKDGAHIYYISFKDYERYFSTHKYSYCAEEDVKFGDYVGEDLVEWFCDAPPEKFKYWIYFPKFK